MKKKYQVIFSHKNDPINITIECTVKAETFSQAEHLACKEINRNHLKGSLTGDPEDDDMKLANYIIDMHIIDDTETFNEHGDL